MRTKFLFLVLAFFFVSFSANAATKYVNSVTAYTLTISSGNTTASTTVSAPTGTYFMLWGGNSTTATTSMAQGMCYVTLSGTTLTATRTTSSTNTCVANVTLVDATSSLVSSVQSGTIAMTSGTSKTATITSVTTTSSSVNLLGWSQGNATFTYAPNRPLLVLTSATVVTASVKSLTTSMTASYQVISWAAGALNSNVQPFTKTWTNSGTTTTVTISSVTVNNAIMLYDGDNQNCCAFAVDNQWAQITGPTTVTVNTDFADADSIEYAGTVVEFVAGVLTQADQKGVVSLSSTTTAAATITSAPTATTAAYITGWGTTISATTTLSEVQPTLVMTNATTLTGSLGSSGTAVIGYEATSFSEGSTPAAQCIPAGNNNIGLIYPMYIAPPNTAYSSLITLVGTYPNVPVIAILNPASGPGSGALAAYTTVIGQLQAAGITVIGYVPSGYGIANTDYAGEDEATIKAMVADWLSFYPTVQGIFYDEMDNTASASGCTSIAGGNCVTLYQQLTAYAHSEGFPVVYGNPGANTVSAYFSSSPPAVDRYMVYETNAYGTALELNNSALCSLYNCAGVAYGVAYSAPNFLLMEQNDGWVFMTDGPSANPYDVAPTYLSTEMAALASYNTGGGSSCPMVPGFP